MASSNRELKTISEDLKIISSRWQKLEERKKILCIFLELRKRAESEETEDLAAHQQEIYYIDSKLRELKEKKAELQRNYQRILKAKEQSNKKDSDPEVAYSGFEIGTKVFYVEPPPSFPAPSVNLDLEKLPAESSKTQCPECNQFVVTETFTSISSLTWLMCFVTAMVGCVAGCCLIPFCTDTFKSTTHRCPKCRTSIAVVKKL
ncbi:uncharacterized protein ACNS7B_010367 isoform 1-T2 [Menidia menidia]